MAHRPDLVQDRIFSTLGKSRTYSSTFYQTPTESEIIASPEFEKLASRYMNDLSLDEGTANLRALNGDKRIHPCWFTTVRFPAAGITALLALSGGEEGRRRLLPDQRTCTQKTLKITALICMKKVG